MSEDELPSVQRPIICSFCGKRRDQATAIFEHGSGFTICNECVVLCLEINAASPRQSPSTPAPGESQTAMPGSANRTQHTNIPRCSFCGKSDEEVTKLILGPDVIICNYCVESYRDAVQDMINRGELKQSELRTLYSARGAVIEIRFRIKEDRVGEFAGARDPLRNLRRELDVEMSKLDSFVFTGVFKKDSDESPNEYRYLAMAPFATNESVSFLKTMLNEHAEHILRPLETFIVEAPQIRVLREERL